MFIMFYLFIYMNASKMQIIYGVITHIANIFKVVLTKLSSFAVSNVLYTEVLS